ncbi:MAG: hypothetical protein IKU25_05800 [Clostridia bacterium]|nr:hypothetical protein [Clostridia bacterium]
MKGNRRLEAVFIKPKVPFSSVTLFIGIALVAFCVYGAIINGGTTTGVTVGAVFGALITAASVFALCLNRKAFLTIEDKHITAKYHWFGKIDCDTSEIEFVMSQINTLIILLKDGTRHIITGISNADRLCVDLQEKVRFETRDNPETIAKELAIAKTTRRKQLICVITSIVATFIILILTIILTNGKDLPYFTTKDWILFWAMVIVIIFPFAVTFWAANNAGRMMLDINHLQYRLRRSIIETAYLPPRKIRAVLTDKDFMGRIIIYEDHNSEIVIISEEINNRMELERVFISEPLDEENYEMIIKDNFQYTINITDKYN